MYSELSISFPLSKRLKTDHSFKNTLFPNRNLYNEIEKGVNVANCLDENESLFSKSVDSDCSDLIAEALRNSQRFKYDKQNDCKDQVTEYKELQRNMRKRVSKHNEEIEKRNRKILTLIPLVIGREPNPIKKIRFLDYVFQLDSEIFMEHIMHPKQHNTVSDISDYKKVKSVTYDPNNKVFITDLVEKTVFKGLFVSFERQIEYYLEWQNSLSNNKAHVFALTIDAIKKKAQLAYREEQEFSNNLESITKAKKFIKKIDEETLAFAKTQPCQTRQHKIELDAKSDQTGLVQEEINWPFQHQLGYEKVDMEEILSKQLKSEIISKSICSKETYEVLTSIFTFKRHTSINNKVQSGSHEGRMMILDKHDNEKYYCRMMILEEKYYDQGNLYKKTYQIPVDIEPINN